MICVGSGKGGVGKSTLTANLAAALAAEGSSVGVLDADVWGYSIPRMYGLGATRPSVSAERMIIPLEAHGVKVMSIGFFVEEDAAVVWRGPMLHKALTQFLQDVDWGALDYLLVDLNYGDYYTPEGFVPASKEATRMPWFVIYPLGTSFSYEQDPSKYKGAGWIVRNLIDATAKGGNFMLGVGPSGQGSFHPTAIEQIKETGRWLKVNGQGIYATRAREGTLWQEGDTLRFTRSKDNRTVYCFALEWPGKTLVIRSLQPHEAGKVELLGYPKHLDSRWDAGKGLVITIPEELQAESNRPCPYAWGLKISRSSAA